jgi:hypothetical protein
LGQIKANARQQKKANKGHVHAEEKERRRMRGGGGGREGGREEGRPREEEERKEFEGKKKDVRRVDPTHADELVYAFRVPTAGSLDLRIPL